MASALLAVSAPIGLVLLALGLASLRERSGPSRPRYKCMWGFLTSALAVPAAAPAPAGDRLPTAPAPRAEPV